MVLLKHMDIKRGSQPHHAKIKRLGKKAIFYGRIASALGVACSDKQASKGRIATLCARAKAFRPSRRQLITACCAVIVVGAGVAGNSVYQSQRAAAAKAAAKAENERMERVNAAAQECYKKKTADKQQMLGKVTFDQLYDGDSCLEQ